jgi:NADH-quinone oxidoreductase subunit H
VTTAIWVIVVETAVLMTAGVYATAVIDALIEHLVARRPVGLMSLIAGPLRTSSLLLMQPLTTTERPDAALDALAPALLGAAAATGLMVVPFHAGWSPGAMSEGIVYFGAAMALVMVGVYWHGWAPNAVFPLIGGYRFVALALSYEMPFALVLIAAALPAQSLSVTRIVESQATLWNVVRQPLGLPLYIVAALGLSQCGPLDVGDSIDLSGGTTAESSGRALLLWDAGRKAVMVATAAMGAAVFLGGWYGPLLPPAAWMSVKTLIIIAVMLTVKHSVGRARLARFVVIAWVVLIPVALLDVFGAGVVALMGANR